MMGVIIYKHGSLLRVRTDMKSVLSALTQALRYRKSIYNATYLQRQAAGGASMSFQYVDCYELTEVEKETQLITPAGYYSRIVKILTDMKVGHHLRRQDDLMTRPVFSPNWDLVSDFEWRHKQKETLQAMLSNERGQVWQATGTGKSWVLVPMCLLLPKANIVITTKHLQVLHEHYHRIARVIGDVGIICSGKNICDRRVMCVSVGSLHRIDPTKVDVVLADEHHEMGTDNFLAKFAEFRRSRMYGLSANVGDRTDGSDFELEGLFGDVLTELTYEEGVSNNMIVPIEVEWISVKLLRNPVAGMTGISVKKYGIWANSERNEMIAEVAKKYVDEQVLITVETVEHACRLKQLLPDYTLCYSVSAGSAETVSVMRSSGVLESPEPNMTAERMFNLKRDFELGIERKVIATTVWNRGVNFHQLQVLIRADGASSSVADTQIPGRLSRLSSGKSQGKLIDFLDEFDSGLKQKASRRMGDYKRKGWQQTLPGGDKVVTGKDKDDKRLSAGDRRRRGSSQD